MKIRILVMTFCLAVVITVSGCTSIAVRTGPLPETGDRSNIPRYVYPGTQHSAEMAALLFADIDPASEGYGWQYLMGPLSMIDLPFCLVFDTALLPYDLYKVTLGGRTRYGYPDR